ncbi:MAG: hypothetical protein MZW92_29460 [Comamonadaceae bacterium]|nr:hypothetical protein [Comamonadaceae bacterium]
MSLDPPACVLLEAAASLRLFGGALSPDAAPGRAAAANSATSADLAAAPTPPRRPLARPRRPAAC